MVANSTIDASPRMVVKKVKFNSGALATNREMNIDIDGKKVNDPCPVVRVLGGLVVNMFLKRKGCLSSVINPLISWIILFLMMRNCLRD